MSGTGFGMGVWAPQSGLGVLYLHTVLTFTTIQLPINVSVHAGAYSRRDSLPIRRHRPPVAQTRNVPNFGSDQPRKGIWKWVSMLSSGPKGSWWHQLPFGPESPSAATLPVGLQPKPKSRYFGEMRLF